MRILLGSSILLSLEYYLKHPDLLIAAVPGATLNYNIYSQFFKNVAANTVTHVYLILCGGNNLWRGKIEREGTKKDYVVHYHRTKYRESSTEVCSKFVVLVNQLKQKFKNAEFCIVPPLGRWCLEEWFSQRTVCDECIIFKQPFSELVDLELKLRKEIGHFCRIVKVRQMHKRIMRLLGYDPKWIRHNGCILKNWQFLYKDILGKDLIYLNQKGRAVVALFIKQSVLGLVAENTSL